MIVHSGPRSMMENSVDAGVQPSGGHQIQAHGGFSMDPDAWTGHLCRWHRLHCLSWRRVTIRVLSCGRHNSPEDYSRQPSSPGDTALAGLLLKEWRRSLHLVDGFFCCSRCSGRRRQLRRLGNSSSRQTSLQSNSATEPDAQA